MNFQTHHDTEIDINGTSLQGCVIVGYDVLNAIFGEPTIGDGYKTDAEWYLRFENGLVATIYNWKNGPNYLGADGQSVHQITEWNIGGHNHRVAELINQLVEEATA